LNETNTTNSSSLAKKVVVAPKSKGRLLQNDWATLLQNFITISTSGASIGVEIETEILTHVKATDLN
jgi:hypothetical protein